MSMLKMPAWHCAARPVCLSLVLVGWCLLGVASAEPLVDPADAPLKLTELLKHTTELQGRTVQVAGLFAGREGLCEGPPPRGSSSSDWMLIDAPHCIYVSGPIPEGIAGPPDISSNGRGVTLRAQVALTKDGRLYLRQ